MEVNRSVRGICVHTVENQEIILSATRCGRDRYITPRDDVRDGEGDEGEDSKKERRSVHGVEMSRAGKIVWELDGFGGRWDLYAGRRAAGF